MSNLLFDDDNDDNEVEKEFKINEKYASSYKDWRTKEEIHKLKAKYGDDMKNLSESDSESDNSSTFGEDDPNNIEFDEKFLHTLACLKNKDPLIHDKNYKFFPELPEKQQAKNKDKKSMSVVDWERQNIIGGKLNDSEDEQEKHEKKVTDRPTYVEQQNELLKNLKNAVALDDDDDDEDNDDFLIQKKTEKKTNYDLLKKDEKLKPLYNYWTDPNLPAHEKFLRDYIQEKKFLNNNNDSDDDDDDDYKDRIHDSDDNLSADEKNVEKQEQFEHKYNFRYEEPDKEFIKRFPRTLEGTMRKKDSRRSEKRAELKLRREEDKKRKKEELLKLKALKRKEIEDKIEKLKEITGNDDMQFDPDYIEEDFDPEQHEKMMEQMFDDKYYEEGVNEASKPEFPGLDEELELETNWDEYNPQADEKYYYDDNEADTTVHCEDENFNMDADYYTNKMFQKELVETSKKKRKRSKFAEMISQEKPQFDPKVHKSLKGFIEMYYNLDYEDMIGDTPCRFKYRKVEPNDYGLTVEEILRADDKELNKWCSLKKTLKYKTPDQERYEVKKYKQKAQNEEFKKKIIPSLYKPIEESENEEDNNVDDTETKKKRKRNKKKKNKDVNVNDDDDDDDSKNVQKLVDSEKKNITDDVDINKKEKKSKKKKLKTDEKVEENIDEVEKSSETNIKTKKHKNKSVDDEKVEEKTVETEETKIKTKKHKNKSVDDEKVEEKIVETEETKIKTKKHKNKSVDDEKVEENIDETIKPDEKKKNKKQKNKSVVADVEEEKTNKIEKTTEVNIKTEKPSNESTDKTNNGSEKKLTQAERKEKYKKLKKLKQLEAKTAAAAAAVDNMNQNKLTQAERREKYLKIQKLKQLKEKTAAMNKLVPDMTDQRLKAYGLNPKKFKNKLKYGC